MRKLFVSCLLAGIALVQAGDGKKDYKFEIKDLKGQIVGTGVLSPASPKGVKLDLTITNLPAGNHAFHIHQKPLCEASEEFDTAGLQYDPTGEMYGNGRPVQRIVAEAWSAVGLRTRIFDAPRIPTGRQRHVTNAAVSQPLPKWRTRPGR